MLPALQSGQGAGMAGHEPRPSLDSLATLTPCQTVHGNFLSVPLAQQGNVAIFPFSSGNFHPHPPWTDSWRESQHLGATDRAHGYGGGRPATRGAPWVQEPPSKSIDGAPCLLCAGTYSRCQGHRTGQTQSLSSGPYLLVGGRGQM